MEQKVDPITFEVLRHRLWSIAVEAAATLRLISGSPVATEVNDFNTSILNAQGEAVIIGPYIASHAIGQSIIVTNILENLQDNPGINVDDMFICNDPYAGALHQNDVTLVAPIHWNGELVAWTGATIHLVDVGGAVKGSQAAIGAQSIYEEAPVIPPVKIIERGTMRKDIEKEYLIRSRTIELNTLDLRAKIAANLTAKKRMQDLIQRYGLETVKGVMDGIIDYTETQLRARLLELPDGTWRHTSYLEHNDGADTHIYPCRVAMTKKGDSLTFDFRGTAKQAPAMTNCAYSGLLSGLIISVFVYLCYDMPWSPAGVARVLKVISEPGTVTHAAWPGGVSRATMAGSFTVTAQTCVCLAKMFAASEKYRDYLMATWLGAAGAQELFGVDQRGIPFGATMLDSMAGGAGARSYKDGVDTGSSIRSLSVAIANAETYEFRYPILYIHRRQERDTGGPGKFRGGVSASVMYTPHDVEEIPSNVMHGSGYEHPASGGINGGYPACTHHFLIKRDSNIQELFAKGIMPSEMEEIQGRLEVIPGVAISYLKKGDVYRLIITAGGGYGDPLDREPDLVARDVCNKLVSLEIAKRIYGVVVDPMSFKVDGEATERQRARIRKERSQEAKEMVRPSSDNETK